MAARDSASYQWADWGGSGSTGGIVKLRTKDNKIVCKYVKASGGKVTFVTLGGSAYTWEVRQHTRADRKSISITASHQLTCPLIVSLTLNSQCVCSTWPAGPVQPSCVPGHSQL